MKSTQSFCDKPKSARKLYCDSTQSSNIQKCDDGFPANNMRFHRVNDYYSMYNFQFPPPPRHHEIISNSLRICSENKNELPTSSDEVDTNSDSSQSDCYPLITKSQSNKNSGMYKFRGYLSDGSPVSHILSILPPIGVFWDIENCQVPKGRSAVIIAQAIRDKFFHGYRETEFLVVCDVKKENAQVIQELNDAQVNLIHVSSQSKNAADDKLRQAMRRFADIHGPPAAIMLISGDINFSSDLCDLRHRKKIHVILLHNDLCSQSLILCANEHHNYSKLVETLPLRGSENLQSNNPVEVLVTNLPLGYDPAKIRNKLKRLSENCGGRVGIITDQTTTIRFSSMEFAARAQKRMNRERVFGNSVFVSTPYNVTDDQENYKNSTKKTNIWKSSDTITSGKEKMFEYQSNGNKSFTVNGNSTNGIEIFSNDYRPHVASARSPHHLNGFTGSRNGRINTYSNVNQENILQPNNLPPWFWTNNKFISENSLKSTRQVLGTCDGNTKCVPSETFSPHSGKTDCLWSYQGQPYVRYNGQQSSYDGQRNVTPPVTILKRNIPTCSDPQEANRIKSVISTNQFNNSVRKNNGTPVENSERYFHPITTNQPIVNQSNQISSPVELQITNLDQSMEPGELKRCLLDAFGEYTKILNLSVYTQSDGNYAASVRVPSVHSAQFVISKLHHKMKIGFRRIVISYPNSSSPHNIALIKSQTLSLLLEVPGHQLPYFKFRELCEKRFKISPSLSDLHKIRDVCVVTEEANGRCISLHPELRNSPSPMLASDRSTPAEQPYCKSHWKPVKVNNDKGWAELEISSLPNVKIKLSELSKNIHHLIAIHNNYLLLASLCDCYEAECGKLIYDDSGVPLEHLVTCISGVELVLNSNTGIKYLTNSNKSANDDKKSDSDSNSCISPSLANNLALFSRELVDLLKTFPHCMMPFNRFIPAYHHHFGRQCRVADYGYTKLIDLMEALPNVVQVTGDSNRRIMTLAHKAQVRRFTSDLLRVLKSLASKQTTVAEFPTLFEKTLNRSFDPVDYGLCCLEDLLSQVSENTIVISTVSGSLENGKDPHDVIIAIPKREQTAEEIERTKVFANEVIELLSHAPQCSMLFNKFIPAYHHHYGHQCKVSDFGFTKLIELFEAIPEIVKIEDDLDGGDRRVTLKEEVKLKVLGDQLASLIMSHRPNDLSLSNLSSIFAWQYGYSLKPAAYGFNSIEELIKNLSFAIKIINTTPQGPILQAVDKNQLKFLALKTKRVLMECSVISQMLYKDFAKGFENMFGETIELKTLEKELSNTVSIIKSNNSDAAIVKLTPVEIFARDVYLLLMFCDGKLPLNSFENAYLRMYSTAVQPAVYGYQTTQALLQAIPHTVVLRGKPPKRIIMINTELASVGFHLPKGLTSTNNFYHTGFSKENTVTQSRGRYSNDGNIKNNLRYDESRDSILNSYSKSDKVDKIPPVILPDLTLHPDTFTATPLTSPHKSLHNTIMFTEHMLHAPVSEIEPPNSANVPYPTFLMGYSNQLEQQFRNCISISSQPNTSSEDGSGIGASESNDGDNLISASVESSTDSFSDGTVSSTNKRKIRLAAHFQGYSEN